MAPPTPIFTTPFEIAWDAERDKSQRWPYATCIVCGQSFETMFPNRNVCDAHSYLATTGSV